MYASVATTATNRHGSDGKRGGLVVNLREPEISPETYLCSALCTLLESLNFVDAYNSMYCWLTFLLLWLMENIIVVNGEYIIR